MASMEEMLVSTWFNAHSSVPSSYVQPPETRPGAVLPTSGNTIPVVDLQHHDRAHLVNHISKASQDYGFFQVINHGVSEEVMENAMKTFEEFHGMPGEEKVKECSKDPNGIRCRLYTSSENYSRDRGGIHFWKDTLTHPCPPSPDSINFWPHKPSNYREVVGKYTEELRKLGLNLLELIGEGLGLGSGYLCGELSENPTLLVNHYPPCPDPTLTLGCSKHRDPSLITILLQQQHVHGLQVLKDGQWIPVDPLPNAFVVNIGLVLQMISNGRVKGPEHRVVTNSTSARTSVAYFTCPSNESIIEPAQQFINGSSPSNPTYRSMTFGEFRKKFFNKSPNIEAELQYSLQN